MQARNCCWRRLSGAVASSGVTRYTLGDVNESTLATIWASDEYARFRAQVRRFNFPSCVDCDLRDTCDIASANDGCWGWRPSCADCFWAQDIVRCS